jgi:hypothetical protein
MKCRPRTLRKFSRARGLMTSGGTMATREISGWMVGFGVIAALCAYNREAGTA